MNERDHAAGGAGGDFEAMPYISLPQPFAHPARIGAVAALHGLEPAPSETARVLELGCGAGGNLIPLAARFPGARFVGLDLSARHITDACARIAELGLANIEFVRADIADAALPAGPYDYILCHGVFSWVPEAARQGVLRICAEALAPSGVALISYNVLPGWRLRMAVRDICLRHMGEDPAPRIRVARARTALDAIANAAPQDTPYGALLRAEARRVAHRPASYLLGEFLAPINEPVSVASFLAQAGRHGLFYLDEADLDAAAPRAETAPMRALLADDEDPVARQSLLDELNGRMFRATLLTRSPRRARRDWSVLRRLHVSADLRRDGDSVRDARGRLVAADDAGARAALGLLADRFPATAPAAELIAASRGAGAALARLAARGHLQIWSHPLELGDGAGERPVAWPLARLENAAAQPWITGQHHAPCLLKPAMRLLLPLLDGAHDRAALAQALETALRSGALRIHDASSDPAADAELYRDRTLAHLARSGVLTRA